MRKSVALCMAALVAMVCTFCTSAYAADALLPEGTQIQTATVTLEDGVVVVPEELGTVNTTGLVVGTSYVFVFSSPQNAWVAIAESTPPPVTVTEEDTPPAETVVQEETPEPVVEEVAVDPAPPAKRLEMLLGRVFSDSTTAAPVPDPPAPVNTGTLTPPPLPAPTADVAEEVVEEEEEDEQTSLPIPEVDLSGVKAISLDDVEEVVEETVEEDVVEEEVVAPVVKTTRERLLERLAVRGRESETCVDGSCATGTADWNRISNTGTAKPAPVCTTGTCGTRTSTTNRTTGTCTTGTCGSGTTYYTSGTCGTRTSCGIRSSYRTRSSCGTTRRGLFGCFRRCR